MGYIGAIAHLLTIYPNPQQDIQVGRWMWGPLAEVRHILWDWRPSIFAFQNSCWWFRNRGNQLTCRISHVFFRFHISQVGLIVGFYSMIYWIYPDLSILSNFDFVWIHVPPDFEKTHKKVSTTGPRIFESFFQDLDYPIIWVPRWPIFFQVDESIVFQIGWKHSWHTGLLLSWEIYIRQLHSPPRHPGNFMNSIIPHLAGWTWVRHGYPTPSLNTNSKVPPLSFQAEIAPQKKRIIQIYLATFHSQLNSLLVSGRGIFRNEVVKPQHLNAKNQLPAKTKNELQLVVPKFSWICFFCRHHSRHTTYPPEV